MIADIQMRQPDRETLAAAVAAHLAAGGIVHQLRHVERAPYRPISYNNRVDADASLRKKNGSLRSTPSRSLT